LFGDWAALAPLTVPVTGLLLHRNVLCRLSVVGLWVHSQLLVKDGQLFVELALGLREFVESRPSLGVGGVTTWCQLRVVAARSRSLADVALPRGVALPCGLYPLGRRSAGGSAGGSASRALIVDVGRHRVVWEAGLSTGVHCGVPILELPPSKWLGFACLKGEVGEVVRNEPKTLLRWVWPQHADDHQALDESFTSRSPHEDVGTRWLGDGLRRPGLDEAEGVEAQGGPRGQRDHAALHQIR
jgi:hypothetical protein